MNLNIVGENYSRKHKKWILNLENLNYNNKSRILTN